MFVRLYATLRPIVGGKGVELDLADGASVQAALDALVVRFPKLADMMFERDGTLYRHVHVFVNGRDVRYLPGEMNTSLEMDDRLELFPAVGGGDGECSRDANGDAGLDITLAGIPGWLVAEYLIEIGARRFANGDLGDHDWTVRLTQVEDKCVGSIAVGQTKIELRGAPDAIERIRPAIEKKLIRAGG
ncbi:MAG: MoaD/ThiS family protein [Chloroflexota bacterium]|nr:MAG: MoaD/ThiS family protein [Chloroflexota bacterium]